MPLQLHTESVIWLRKFPKEEEYAGMPGRIQASADLCRAIDHGGVKSKKICNLAVIKPD